MPDSRRRFRERSLFWSVCGLLVTVVAVSAPPDDQDSTPGASEPGGRAEELRRELAARMTLGDEALSAAERFVSEVVRRARVEKKSCPSGLEGSPVCGSVPHDLRTLGPIVEEVAIGLVAGGARVLDFPHLSGPERLAPYEERAFQRVELWIDHARVRIWVEDSSPFHSRPGPKQIRREIVISIEPSAGPFVEVMPADP